MRETYKGRYQPKNPEKYKGDRNDIIYRSLWERKFMVFCDMKEAVIAWSSETVVVPYISPVDQKSHRYFVDFIIKIKNKDGIVETHLVEVKPEKQCMMPERGRKQKKTFITEATTYVVNQAKWEAAKKYAETRGWKFTILTEKDLNIKV
jgi:hypothetical protein